MKSTALVSAFLSSFLLHAVAAEESQNETGSSTEAERTTQSGYKDLPVLGGPESVAAEFKRNDRDGYAVFQVDTLRRTLAPCFDWKRQVQEENGFAMGFQ